ncbi:integral membrane sensor signal transduction histidine kinase [Candidatus Magnetoovum chiemensis]|nr:integral membrane sensor signal transduction histidine kinase [Candidatus Magnetoovum chiemensis]
MALFGNCADKWYKCALRRLHNLIERQIDSDHTDSINYDEIQKNEKESPRFPIKTHIYIGLTVTLFVAVTIGILLTYLIYRMEKNSQLIDISNKLQTVLYNARQHESDYLLTNNSLAQTFEYLKEGKKLILENYKDFVKLTDDENKLLLIEKYERAVELLQEIDKNKNQKKDNTDHVHKRNEAIAGLREVGSKLTLLTTELIQNQKDFMDKTMVMFYTLHLYAVMFFLVFSLFIVHLLGFRILKTIKNMNTFTNQVAGGNYSATLPRRHVSDEFSDMSNAIKQMIKELDRQQNVLAQSHKLRAVGTLTAGIAHELNNPINNITLTAHMLLEDYYELSDEEIMDMINDLVDQASRSKNIVRNLLDFARESESLMESLPMDTILKETIKLSGSQIKLSGVNVELRVSPNLPRIHGDRQQLQQVFLNLILNAIDVTPKGGKIIIDADHDTSEPNFVAVKVIDFGEGIHDHVLHHIFDPFFTTKSKGKGTGLGLSVSQGIIAKHGGHITVNTKVNRGTTFTVKLPITANINRRHT